MPIQPPTKPIPQDVDVNAIQSDPKQERRHFDEEALQELASSIRRQGVINPISLQPAPEGSQASYQIIAGERRWRAAKLADLRAIPAMLYIGLTRLQVVMIQMEENDERVDTPLLDRAARISTLVDEFGAAAVATARDKSAAWVSKLVNVHRLPPVVKAIIQSGKLDSVDTAFELAKMVKLSEDHDLTQASLEDARQNRLLRSVLRARLQLLDTLVRPPLPIEPPAPEVRPEKEAPPAAAGEGAPPDEPPAPALPAEVEDRDILHDFEASMRSAAAPEPRDDAAAEAGATLLALSQLTDPSATEAPAGGASEEEATEPEASDEAQAIKPAVEPVQEQPEPEVLPASIVVAPGALAALAQLLAGGEKVTATLSLGSEPRQLQCVVVTTLGAEPANLSAEGKAARMRLAVPIAWKAPADSIDADFISYLSGKTAARAGDVQAYQAAQQKKPIPPPAPKPAASKPAAKPAKKKPAPKPVKAAKPAKASKAQKPAAKPKPAKAIPEAPSTPPGLFSESQPKA